MKGSVPEVAEHFTTTALSGKRIANALGSTTEMPDKKATASAVISLFNDYKDARSVKEEAWLEAWAQYQGRPTANLAAFLIETGIRQAKANNEFKTLEPDQPQSGKGGKP